MEMLNNSTTWFEVPVADFDRAKKFYSAIYDYQMPDTMVGSVRMGFLLYEQKEHRVGGAILSRHRIYTLSTRHDTILKWWLVSIPLGGKILVPKTFIGESLGYFAKNHRYRG